MLTLIVTAGIGLLIFYAIYWFVNRAGVPEPIRFIAYGIMVLVAIIWLWTTVRPALVGLG